MDQLVTAHFDRVEKALSTLVDSIAAYNPSPQAAIDLVAADDELSHGLDELARHQANNARIQALQTEAEALEEQLKSSVSALASLRRELFETPATTFPTDARPVPFDELLQYAKNIAQHTVPPTYRERTPIPPPAEKEDAPSSAAPTNGVNTPANAPEPMDISKATPEAPKEGENPVETGPNITAEEEEWLKKLKEDKRTWYPWPSYDKIRGGNLYKLMFYEAKNKDLDTFDVAAFEESLRNKDLSEHEVKNPELEAAIQGVQVPQQQQQQPREPRPPPKIFRAFDDLEMDD